MKKNGASKRIPRILIIDDDPIIREILSESLDQQGYDTNIAEDGKAGLGLHKTDPFDLIITDIIMPNMEGIETIVQLRTISPNVKIIAMSGGGYLDSDSYLLMARRLGAHMTFQKPLNLNKVNKGIQTLLQLQN